MLKKTLLHIMFLIFWGTTVSQAAETCRLDVINPTSYHKILDYLLISPQDVTIYKKAFRAVEVADFDKADDLQSDLGNNIILGHLLAAKYLHPDYKAQFSELQQWLQEYSDLPQASRIYNLAARKGKISELVTPQKMAEKPIVYGWKNKDLAHLSAASQQYLVKQVGKFRKALAKGKTKIARMVLEQPRFRQTAPDKYWDEMAASLSMKYLVDNQNQLAWQWATKASRRKTSSVAPWVAGLAAWKMQKYQKAAVYFSQLANSHSKDSWMLSAGGYWAYRAYQKLGQKTAARQMLKQAAQYKHTFYGILAAYKSGEPQSYNWNAVAYLNDFGSQDYIYELLSSPHIRRAVILLKAKQKDLAEQELRFGYHEMSDKQKEATIYIANQFQMHALAIYGCKQINDSEKSYDGVAYPIPQWLPDSDWKVDKALVLALIRQESSFKPEAKSPAGAKGLMQLMPNTAYHITKDINLKRDSSRLLKPEVSLDLGQRYVNYLMDKTFIQGNLFYMMTAYNAGPGNLVRWQKSAKYGNDPLLFIEVIPSAETRIYIERVIANYWIYNMRFGLVNPTLQQVAEGKWPVLPRD